LALFFKKRNKKVGLIMILSDVALVSIISCLWPCGGGFISDIDQVIP